MSPVIDEDKSSLDPRLVINVLERLSSLVMVVERLLDRFAMFRFWFSSRVFPKDRLAPEVDAVSSVVFSLSFSFSLKCCDAHVKESTSSESSFGSVLEDFF